MSNTCSEDDGSCLAATAAAVDNTTTSPHWLVSFVGDFKWQNTLFVSASTLTYTFIMLTVIYFWWANRQFHFKKRKKDGSRLSSLATKKDAVKLNAMKKKRQKGTVDGDNGDDDDGSSDDDVSTVAGLVEDDEEEADLSDYDTDNDDDDDDDNNGDDIATTKGKDAAKQAKNMEFLKSFPPDKRRNVRDLTSVVANMEVFSYLSHEAFVQCLNYMEYVDLKQGQVLFDEKSYDGSLYAVVKGEVKCQFEFVQRESQMASTSSSTSASSPLFAASMDEGDEEEEPFIAFTAGDGDVVTSLLSVLAGLVRQCQERGPSTANDTDSKDKQQFTQIVPAGIAVMAMGMAEGTTRLVRVPPKCFLAMVDKFPRDVHRIAQTIIARMQRVTLQTVVRCLGLHKEIVQRQKTDGNSIDAALQKMERLMKRRDDGQNRPAEAWQRLQSALPSYLPDAVAAQHKNQINQDAAVVAATVLMGPPSSSSLEDSQGTAAADQMEDLVQALQKVASVVALSPGQTLLETGEKPDAIYIVLHGSLDVGMHVPGASAVLKQSTRRASIHKERRPASTSDGPPGAPPKPMPLRRKYSSKGVSTSSTSNVTATTTNFSRIYKATVGEIVGTLSCFTGDVSIVTVRNSSEWEHALLYKVSKDTYDALLAEHPNALTECLGSILDRLCSPIVTLLDWNVEWMHVQAGEDVVHRGEECDAMYAVLNGRLRAAVPYSNNGGYHHHPPSHKTTRVPPGIIHTGSSPNNRKRSFLSRAKYRLRNRRGLLKFLTKSNPKVANAPPPLSRRMMNSTGEEVQGDEYGRGSIIGEVEILTGADWSSDVYASRHSELARVPVSVLNVIIRMCPRAGLHLARVVASQIQKKDARKRNAIMGAGSIHDAFESGSPSRSMPSTPTSTASASAQAYYVGGRNILPSYSLNLSTIAVVPLLEGAFDIDVFSSTLQQTLNSNIAPTKLMTKAFAREKLGDEVFRQRNAMHHLKMTRLCGDMEESYRVVVYQAEANYTWWTRLCIQQADCILLVVRAEEAPPQKKVEACLSWAFAALNVKIQLVVLQSPSNSKGYEDDETDETFYETKESSDQLNDWSEARYWIAGHHLVRMPFKKHVRDFQRLCRRITGRSVGVVLGGGGARGLAHIGVVRALMEAGITVDFVGGTSQGAYIGALLAMQPDDLPALVLAARQMAASMSNNWEKLFDLTLPLVSFFSGYRFNRGIQKSLGRRRIQDLVCNFFCVSTDLRNNVQVVHTKGICWRYVRASMTLQSYLPPLSEDGTLLVDGGYMNVLPADVMKRQMRARTVIAVDVSQEVILDNYEYGSHLSGWWILYNSWNPFVKTVNIPSMGDISERLAWVSGERHKKKVKEHIDLFLQPPVGNFGVLEYDKFDEIVALGYEYAKPRVDNFVKKYPHLVS